MACRHNLHGLFPDLFPIQNCLQWFQDLVVRSFPSLLISVFFGLTALRKAHSSIRPKLKWLPPYGKLGEDTTLMKFICFCISVVKYFLFVVNYLLVLVVVEDWKGQSSGNQNDFQSLTKISISNNFLYCDEAFRSISKYLSGESCSAPIVFIDAATQKFRSCRKFLVN